MKGNKMNHLPLAFGGPGAMEIAFLASFLLSILFFFIKKKPQAKVVLGIATLLYLPAAYRAFQLLERGGAPPWEFIGVIVVAILLIVGWITALTPKKQEGLGHEE